MLYSFTFEIRCCGTGDSTMRGCDWKERPNSFLSDIVGASGVSRRWLGCSLRVRDRHRRTWLFQSICGESKYSHIVCLACSMCNIYWLKRNPLGASNGTIMMLNSSESDEICHHKNNMIKKLTCFVMFYHSKKNPTYPWNIPRTLNHLFLKGILSHLDFGMSGVCSWALLEFS